MPTPPMNYSTAAGTNSGNARLRCPHNLHAQAWRNVFAALERFRENVPVFTCPKSWHVFVSLYSIGCLEIFGTGSLPPPPRVCDIAIAVSLFVSVAAVLFAIVLIKL